MRTVVIGGGVSGLGAALLLARAGHAVTLLERDATPFPADPVSAFESWERWPPASTISEASTCSSLPVTPGRIAGITRSCTSTHSRW